MLAKKVADDFPRRCTAWSTFAFRRLLPTAERRCCRNRPAHFHLQHCREFRHRGGIARSMLIPAPHMNRVHTVTDREPRLVAEVPGDRDRKSTRLNSSHGYISYAVFCLKKK